MSYWSESRYLKIKKSDELIEFRISKHRAVGKFFCYGSNDCDRFLSVFIGDESPHESSPVSYTEVQYFNQAFQTSPQKVVDSIFYRVLRPPVLSQRRQPLPVRPSGALGGVRGGLRGLQEVHGARGGVRRHRDSEDGKGDRQNQGRGRQGEEGQRLKRPGGLTPAAKLKNRHQPDCGRASFFFNASALVPSGIRLDFVEIEST